MWLVLILKHNSNQQLKQRGQDLKFIKSHKRLLYGSVFLMATSAIGPAFLTQTAVFTAQFYASFAFAILISILMSGHKNNQSKEMPASFTNLHRC